jgi:hypothetical protein
MDRANVFRETPLTPEEMQEFALSEYQTILQNVGGGGLSPSPTATEPAVDPLEGQTVQHPVNGSGKVIKVGDDQYVVDFPGGSTNPVTGAQVQQLLGTNSVN